MQRAGCVVAAQCVRVNVRSAAGSSVGLARSRARASIYSTVTPRGGGGTGAVTGKQDWLTQSYRYGQNVPTTVDVTAVCWTI